jgi:hypothetical protein
MIKSDDAVKVGQPYVDGGKVTATVTAQGRHKKVKIINFPNMCSNIPVSPAYGVYISQLIRYARASSNYSDFLKKTFLRHTLTQKIFLTFFLTSLSLNIFTI